MKKALCIICMIFFVLSLFSQYAIALPSEEANSDGTVMEFTNQYIETTGVATKVDTNLNLEAAEVHFSDDSTKSKASEDKIIYPDGITFYSTDEITRSSYANYDPDVAAAYAVTYAYNPNTSQFKTLDNDCTNFVSQAIAVGGVYSYINYDFTGTPAFLRDWVCEDNPNAWYMIKKTKPNGSTYWAFSKTWGFVNNFRSFQTNHAAGGSNTFHGTLSGGTPNTTPNVNTNFEYKLRKKAAVGQVWQLDGHHSIIITAVTQRTGGYNYVWYAAHDDPHDYQDIQDFLSWCYDNYRTTDIYRLKFS